MAQNYNPKEIKRASNLVTQQEALREDKFRVLRTAGAATQQDYLPVDQNYFYNAVTSISKRDNKDAKNITEATELAQKDQTDLYPYTFDIPNRDYWESRERYTDDKGRALWLDQDKVMGQTFVDPSYYQYVADNYKREDALAFQTWIINQLDFSNPVKKDYVRRRFPQLFEFIVQGQEKKMRDTFIRDVLLLRGPRSEEEFRYIYNTIVKKDLYNKPLLAISALNIQDYYPPALPAPVISPTIGYTPAEKKQAGNLFNNNKNI